MRFTRGLGTRAASLPSGYGNDYIFQIFQIMILLSARFPLILNLSY